MQPFIRTQAIEPLRDFFTKIDIDDDTKIHSLDKMETRDALGFASIPLGRFVDALETADHGDCPSKILWKAGKLIDYSSRGKFGRTVLASNLLGTALQRLIDYFPLFQGATKLNLEVDDTWAVLTYQIVDPNIWPRHADALYSLSIYSSMIESAHPNILNACELSFESHSPGKSDCISNFSEIRCVYGEGTNSLRFPAKILNLPLGDNKKSGSSELTELKTRMSEMRVNMNVMDRVKIAIYNNILGGRVCQEDVASELGLTPRTLRRRLSVHNTSYRELQIACQMQLAELEFKKNANVSLSEVALRLGYAEHSTFSRAFAKCKGYPPHEYRKAMFNT